MSQLRRPPNTRCTRRPPVSMVVRPLVNTDVRPPKIHYENKGSLMKRPWVATEAQNTAVPSSDELERLDQAVTDEDLRILQRADKILASAAAWNRHDTRVCNPMDRTWSLLCALDKASLEVLGEYRHREVAVQVDQVRRHQACSQSSDGSRCRAARGPEEERNSSS